MSSETTTAYRDTRGSGPAFTPAEAQELVEGLVTEFETARDDGQDPRPQVWLERYPEVAPQLAEFFRDAEAMGRLAASLLPQPPDIDLPTAFKDYQILRLINRGGMGVVYKAQQRNPRRIVALKVIRPDRLEGLSADERRQAIQRFQNEAQAAALLAHEYIVGIHEVGEADGQPFYSMRYVEGPSLAALLKKGPLEGRRAATYLEKVARAMHEAHRHGILHRDLKPHNILIEAETDRPLVTDFGLAKLVQAEREMTRTGDVMGTPAYMSPEQAECPNRVTVASDVYSLGATPPTPCNPALGIRLRLFQCPSDPRQYAIPSFPDLPTLQVAFTGYLGVSGIRGDVGAPLALKDNGILYLNS